METGQRRDEDEEVMGGGGGEEQRRERRQEMEEESGEARREGEIRGGKGGGSWVDSGKCLSAPSAGGWQELCTHFLQHSSPSTAGCPQAPRVNSKDKMRLVFQRSKYAAHMWVLGLL